tara:strand:- start:604 stop:1272 length:669 start_codon:yes stop_codon:yes gene_type:complete
MSDFSWKGNSTNIVVPVLTEPDLNAVGTPFKARPLKHYRKRLVGGGSGKLRSMPMDIPGGMSHTNKTNCNDINNGDVYVIKENINHVINCNDACKPIRSGIQDNMKDNNGNVIKYGDTMAYLRARCMSFEQNTKHMSPCNGNNQQCSSKTIIHKPNNSSGHGGGFKTQGAVSSGDRILRLKVNTISSNGIYRGDIEKINMTNKITPCLRWRRQGNNSRSLCS